MQYQKLIYEGYLGGDPELKYLPNGTPVTNFSLASSRRYKKDGNNVDETTWLKVAAFGGTAEIIHKYTHKGSHVLIEGALRPGKDGTPSVYEKKDGSHASSYEVVLTGIRILDTKTSQDAEKETSSDVSEIGSGDLPF